MDCRQTQEFLEAFVREELEDQHAREVATHLKTCATCRAVHDDIFTVRVALSEFAAENVLAPTSDFNRRTLEKFAALQNEEQDAARKANLALRPAPPQNTKAPLPRGLGVSVRQRPPFSQLFPRLWAPLALACLALIIFLTPPLRTAWQAQTTQSVSSLPPLTEDHSYEIAEWIEARQRAIAARHPENLRWQAAAISLHEAHRERMFDPLWKQRPNDPYLLARRMVMEFFEEQYPLEDARVLDSRSKKLRAARAESLMPLLERGAALEPDNAFWKWRSANLLLLQGKADLALRAVDEGLKQKTYNDYSLETRRQIFALWQSERPLLAEQKIVLWERKPHFNVWSRPLIRDLMRDGARAEKSGEHQRALQIYERALRLCDVLPKRDFDAWTQTHEMFWLLWQRGVPPRAKERTVNDFAAYARQHGRHDLANIARRNSAEAAARWNIWNQVMAEDRLPGVPKATRGSLLLQNVLVEKLNTLFKAGAQLWLVLGLLMWLLATTVRRYHRRLPRILVPTQILNAPRRTALILPLIVCLLVAVPALILEIAIPARMWYLEMGQMPSAAEVDRWIYLGRDPNSVILLFVGNVLRVVLPWSTLFWALLACWSLAVRAQECAAGDVKPNDFHRLFKEHDFSAFFPLMLNWTLNLSTVVAWVVLIVWWDENTFIYLFGFTLLCAFLCLLRVAVRWARLPHRRAALGLTFVSLHRVLGASLVAGVVLWIGLQLAVQPARNRVDTAIETLLRDGEMKVVMRRAVELSKSS